MAITLIENFRAVFYTPFYAAFALRAFETEGVDVRLEMSSDARKTLSGLLTGTGHVSWGGPMRLLHALDENPNAGLVAFCEVVGRDPFYLLGRTPNPGFRMPDLADKTLAEVTEVPTPWYCLQHDLRLAGVNPADLRRAPGRSMAENVARLKSGEVDVIQVFEPFAQQLVDQGIGHKWYAAASRGPTSYTTFNTTREFLAQQPETALRMTRAMYRTQQWIAAHDGNELAQTVASYFPDIPVQTLATCCGNYKTSGIWNLNPIQQRAGVEWLRDAMLGCGAIRRNINFEDLADMRFADQVVHDG